MVILPVASTAARDAEVPSGAHPHTTQPKL